MHLSIDVIRCTLFCVRLRLIALQSYVYVRKKSQKKSRQKRSQTENDRKNHRLFTKCQFCKKNSVTDVLTKCHRQAFSKSLFIAISFS